MLSLKKWSWTIVFVTAIFAARPALGAPALTTIQDVLYKADGTRFNGVLQITWTNFQTGNNETIPTQAITVIVTNGILRVDLVPTTNASAGANYTVRYMSAGKFQFSEIWAVPPSTAKLKVRDVRIGIGEVVGPPPNTAIAITDVTSLSSELALRASKGASYQPARAAVINSSGLLDAASGNLTDCIRVDGSSGPCGGGSDSSTTLVTFVDGETPAGLVDGSNAAFTLRLTPSPASSLSFYRNGMIMRNGLDFSFSGQTVTFITAAIPQPGDVLQAYYRAGDPDNPLSSFTPAQVVCSSTGNTTSAASLTALGTCTLPAGVIRPGDRIEIRFDYSHQGTENGFTVRVAWGTTSVFNATGTTQDAILSGRTSLGASSTGVQWTTEVLAPAIAVFSGVAVDSFVPAIPIVFSGALSTAGSDSLSLTNFSVIRYPAQANP